MNKCLRINNNNFNKVAIFIANLFLKENEYVYIHFFITIECIRIHEFISIHYQTYV